MLKLWQVLVCHMAINISYSFVKANVCLGGQDIFATVRENSPPGTFVANLSITKDPGANSIRLCLTGDNADWFYLEEKSIRLNASLSRVLDREVHGPVLIAALTCYEDDAIQGKLFQTRYRVTVEILNENDNVPVFLEQTVQAVDVSELTAVNTVVLTLQATDADNDPLVYVIDTSPSTDGSFFRLARPTAGKVLLAKPLDYETKARLQFVVYAVEKNTKEKYNSSASVTVNVLDADDQYPQFQPCAPLSLEDLPAVCSSPVYTVNITEEEQDTVLYFSPGPIHAEDGDRGLMAPLVYTILSGADDGRFQIDRETGEVVLTRRVEDRLLTPSLPLRIMASQRDDPNKYAVATALIRVLAQNRFPPQFNRTAYRGFVAENSSPATLANTDGGEVLLVQAADRDFRDGINPKLQYSLSPKSNSTGLFHITQEGLIIARANQLRAPETHLLEVLAADQESGEVVNASIHIEVLQKEQHVPQSPFGEGRLFGMVDVDVEVGVAGGLVGVVVLLLAVVLCLLLQLLRVQKKKKKQEDPGEQSSTAPGKQPNAINHEGARPLIDELSYDNEGFAKPHASSSILQGKHGVYTRKGSMTGAWTPDKDRAPHAVDPLAPAPPPPPPPAGSPPVAATRSAHKSVSFQDEVTPEENGVTPPDGSRRAHAQRETKQGNVAMAVSPRQLLFRQSNKMGRAVGGEDRKDKSDAADTPPKGLNAQDGGDNDVAKEMEVPENPYKL